MGLSSVMQTALTGISAAETVVGVAAHNLANSQTAGFKESRTARVTQTPQTQSAGAGPSADSGGTNPIQIGNGVRVGQISPDVSQGSIAITSGAIELSNTDLGRNLLDLVTASFTLRASVQTIATADDTFESLAHLGRH